MIETWWWQAVFYGLIAMLGVCLIVDYMRKRNRGK